MRFVRRAGIAAIVAALACSVLSFSATAHAASSPHTVAVGAELAGTGGVAHEQAITAFENQTGHKLAFTREYLYLDSPFPSSYDQWLAARGTIPMVSVFPRSGGKTIPWSTIAAAQPGSTVYNQMKTWADEIKAFGAPVYFTFNHEPEAAASNVAGTNPADFIAAWRNFHNVFDAEGVTNARWIWIMTSYAFIVPPSDHRYGWNWYPGDAYVDDLGADAYTFYTCHNNNPGGVFRSLSYAVSGFLKFGGQHPDKPLWLPEWGVVEAPDKPGAKAQWLTDAQSLFKGAAYQQFVGIGYFNVNVTQYNCDWRVSSTPGAQAAYNALAQDPFYQGSADWSVDNPPTASITNPANGATINGTIEVDANAADDHGVTGVEFDVDGQPLATDSTAPFTASLNTTTLSDDSHVLTAVATDSAGQTTTSAAVTVTVDNSAPADDPPQVSITQPTNGATISGTTTVKAPATDDVGVTSVALDVDGTQVATSSTAPYTFSLDTTNLSNASHTLTAVATDTAGQTTTSGGVGVTVSNVAASSCPATAPGTTELSGNLSLETNQTGWTGVYNANSKVSRVTVAGGSYDGGAALQLSPKPGTTGPAGVNNVNPYWVPGSPGLATAVGRSYTGSAEVRAATAGTQVSVLVRETTPSGTGVASATKKVTLNDTAWHPISTTYTAKNAGDSIRYSLFGTFTASTQSLLADCLSLTTPQ